MARWLRYPLLLSTLLLACGPKPSGQVSDFQLADVCPGSPRYGQQVSPRDYVEKVSAWYFGHST